MGRAGCKSSASTCSCGNSGQALPFLSVYTPLLRPPHAPACSESALRVVTLPGTGRCWSPLLCLPRCGPDGPQHEARARPSSPGHDGLHRVPDIGPHCAVLPLELDQDQLADIQLQRDKERVGFITNNFFAPGRHKGSQTTDSVWL